MAASPKLKRDRIYQIFFAIHMCSILLVDLVPLYPRHLWEPEGAPGRILWHIRQYYIHSFNDPFFTTPHDELPSWYILFTYLEVAIQIPMNWWIWRVFEVLDHGTTPGFELACVAYGVQVSLTTLTCLFDVAYWDDAVYSVADKSTFIFGLYGPFVVIPLVFSIDMGRRLLARCEEAEKLKSVEAQKKNQ